MRVRNRVAARSAFTLMEVLVVVAIVVVLAGLGGSYIMRSFEDSKRDAARLGVAEIAKAVDIYRLRFGPPQSLEQLVNRTPDGGPALLDDRAKLLDPWNRPYIYDPTSLHPTSDKPHIYSEGPYPGNPASRISNWNE